MKLTNVISGWGNHRINVAETSFRKWHSGTSEIVTTDNYSHLPSSCAIWQATSHMAPAHWPSSTPVGEVDRRDDYIGTYRCSYLLGLHNSRNSRVLQKFWIPWLFHRAKGCRQEGWCQSNDTRTITRGKTLKSNINQTGQAKYLVKWLLGDYVMIW